MRNVIISSKTFNDNVNLPKHNCTLHSPTTSSACYFRILDHMFKGVVPCNALTECTVTLSCNYTTCMAINLMFKVNHSENGVNLVD